MLFRPNNSISLSTSSLFYIEKEKLFNNESISFICVIQGELDITSRDFSGRMRRGDLILLKQTGECRIMCLEKSLVLSVHFDYIFFTDSFGEDFAGLECNSVLHPLNSNAALLSALVSIALTHTSDRTDNRFLILQQVYEFFHLLKAECVPHPDESSTDHALTKQELKQRQFTAWMQTNYMSAITLQDAADHMGYTPQYLSNFIKKQFGVTFNTYLNRLRLDAAVKYLKFRDLPIEQISFVCGFSSAASFLKIFQKEYLTTPDRFRTDFRNSIHNDSAGNERFTEPSFIRDYLANSVLADDWNGPEIIESIEKQELSCDIHSVTPLRPVWNMMINLGSADNFDTPIFREHVTMLQHDFHFKYGRVTNILSAVRIYALEDNHYMFDYSAAFTMIDFLLSLDMLPFLDLGNKAPDIYLAERAITVKGTSDMGEIYRTMLPDFIRQCVNRYGFDEVSEWQFELWTIYTDKKSLSTETASAYFNRFQFVYRTVKSILPEARVGGPGYNSFSDIRALDEVLELLESRHLYPDFISAYIYPYAHPPKNASGSSSFPIYLRESPDFFRQDLEKIKKICASHHMGQIPLYITEFSTHIISKNHFNDSIYQATFITKQFLDNWSSVDLMGYWIASDHAMDYPDSNAFLFGGNGIISRNGIRKPGYHVFSFLSQLGTDLIAQGKNYIVTHSYDDHYQVLLYNYAHFTTDYCRHSDRYEVQQYPEAAFEEKQPFQLTLHLTGLREGSYKICRQIENASHGSIFHEWGKLNYSTSLNEREMLYFRNTGFPEMTIFEQSVKDTLSITEKVTRNEICLLTIERIS